MCKSKKNIHKLYVSKFITLSLILTYVYLHMVHVINMFILNDCTISRQGLLVICRF